MLEAKEGGEKGKSSPQLPDPLADTSSQRQGGSGAQRLVQQGGRRPGKVKCLRHQAKISFPEGGEGGHGPHGSCGCEVSTRLAISRHKQWWQDWRYMTCCHLGDTIQDRGGAEGVLGEGGGEREMGDPGGRAGGREGMSTAGKEGRGTGGMGEAGRAGRTQEEKTKGKRQEKPLPQSPSSPPPMPKVKNRLCGERETE